MADGQLRTHSFEVFATVDVPRTQHPGLTLVASHSVTKQDPKEDARIEPISVAPNQSRIITIGGKEQAAQGTLLLFNLDGYPTERWKPMTRVRPILSWGAPKSGVCSPTSSEDSCNVLVSEEEINIGNPVAAYGYSGLMLVLLILVVKLTGGAKVLKIQSGNGERFSLSRCQAAAWTVAVGWVVLTFGIMMRATPQLPWQVTALMGLSVFTATISNRQDSLPPTGSTQPDAAKNAPSLIGDDDDTLSFSRVQMLVWTVISLVLFISKSVLQGVIWEVPVELVALMGVSQAGYLAPKILGSSASSRSEKDTPRATSAVSQEATSPSMQTRTAE